MPKLLNGVCTTKIDGVYDEDHLDRAVTKITTLINQNEQGLGYFYLHPIVNEEDDEITDVLATRSVAMLRVKISLRKVHYDVLLQSRRLGLAQPYASKLGWLVGNLYSRVATPDWEDKESKASASKEQAKKILEVVSKPERQNWVSGRILNAKLVGQEREIHALDPASFKSDLDKIEFESPARIAAEEARIVATRLALEAVDLEVNTKFENTPQLVDQILENSFDPPLSEMNKQAIREDKKFVQRLAAPFASLCKELVSEVYWDDHNSPLEWCTALSSLLEERISEEHFSKAKARIKSKLKTGDEVAVLDFATENVRAEISQLLLFHWLSLRNCSNIMKKLPNRLRNASVFMDNTKHV